MKKIEEIVLNPKIRLLERGADGGAFAMNVRGQLLFIVMSWGDGWDHVSASFDHRCPTWEEMCMVKNIFFRENEMVVQYHPTKEDYVNNHPFCLHLWKPHGLEIPKPPKYMVG